MNWLIRSALVVLVSNLNLAHAAVEPRADGSWEIVRIQDESTTINTDYSTWIAHGEMSRLLESVNRYEISPIRELVAYFSRDVKIANVGEVEYQDLLRLLNTYADKLIATYQLGPDKFQAQSFNIAHDTPLMGSLFDGKVFDVQSGFPVLRMINKITFVSMLWDHYEQITGFLNRADITRATAVIAVVGAHGEPSAHLVRVSDLQRTIDQIREYMKMSPGKLACMPAPFGTLDLMVWAEGSVKSTDQRAWFAQVSDGVDEKTDVILRTHDGIRLATREDLLAAIMALPLAPETIEPIVAQESPSSVEQTTDPQSDKTNKQHERREKQRANRQKARENRGVAASSSDPTS